MKILLKLQKKTKKRRRRRRQLLKQKEEAEFVCSESGSVDKAEMANLIDRPRTIIDEHPLIDTATVEKTLVASCNCFAHWAFITGKFVDTLTRREYHITVSAGCFRSMWWRMGRARPREEEPTPNLWRRLRSEGKGKERFLSLFLDLLRSLGLWARLMS